MARLRSITFDSWLFAGMMTFVSAAVAAGLYVSYTSQRYVAEVIGGMPSNVSVAFPLTIDAAVAAGLLGEWWLAGRRKRERFAFGYMIAFGLVFAALTVGGNALHGALALTVQRPIELHVGGRLVPLPWWIPIAVSAVPGLAIAGAGFALSLVVSAWRHERLNGGALSATEAEALRQQLAEVTATATLSEAQLESARAAREQFAWTLTESEAELHRQLADVERSGEEARSEAVSANAARERAEEMLASQVRVASLLELELAEARTARERAEKLLARMERTSAGLRQRTGRQTAKNGAGSGPAREQRGPQLASASNGGTAGHGAHEPDAGVPMVVSGGPAATGSDAAHEHLVQQPPSVVASNGRRDDRDAHEQGSAAGRAEDSGVAREHEERPAAEDLREQVAGEGHGAAREQDVRSQGEVPEPPPDDRPRGGRRVAQKGARDRAHGRATRVRAGAHEQAPHGARPSRDAVEAMVASAYEQVLAERSLLASTDGLPRIDEDVAARVSESGHEITASRVRFYLAAVRHDAPDQAEPDPAAHRLRVITTQAAAPVAAAKEA